MSTSSETDDVTGKTALITGSSRGIGSDIARTFAKRGLNVIINYNHSPAPAKTLLQEIKNEDGSAIIVKADVSKSDEVLELVNQAKKIFGSIDILINNAAIAKKQNIKTVTESDWDQIIEVNLKSVFLMTQQVLPEMRKHKWGRIINLSSVAAFKGGLVGPHYTASKAGILGLTRYYASRLVKENITVNAIAPAIIETDMVKKANLDHGIIPVGRFGQPREVSEVAWMLIRNGYITDKQSMWMAGYILNEK